MAVYYNEVDPFSAAWLRNLMKEGLIPDGEVDTRSIIDVRPSDLGGFKQCHFFAGIAGWSHALRLAGWADDREIWTGSCPCQPFSVAGKGKGTADERHLWPVFFNLIRECRPPVVMGEQVAGKAGYGWLDGVATDLEGEDYACRAIDIPACSVDAPHIRQRLYWIAVAQSERAREGRRRLLGPAEGAGALEVRSSNQSRGRGADNGCGDMADTNRRNPREGRGDDGEMRRISAAQRQSENSAAVFGGSREGYRDMGNADSAGRQARDGISRRAETRSGELAHSSAFDMADPSRGGRENGRRRDGSPRQHVGDEYRAGSGDGSRDRAARGSQVLAGNAGAARVCDMADADDAGREGRLVLPQRADERSAWSDGMEWRSGADGKARRVKSGVRLLADGVPNRVGRLRGFGNAIVPPLAAEVIKALMETV